jgi:hypothetical protein
MTRWPAAFLTDVVPGTQLSPGPAMTPVNFCNSPSFANVAADRTRQLLAPDVIWQ